MRLVMLTLLFVFCVKILFAHGGRTDANGGHVDKKTGVYHYHKKPTADESKEGQSSNQSSVESEQQRKARTEARKNARTTSKSTGKTLSKPNEINFRFHDVEEGPYDVTSFEDNGKNWRCILMSGPRVNLSKDRIVRIESVSDSRSYRTWFDAAGKSSVVAKYVKHDGEVVVLEKIDKKQITVKLVDLSDTDKKHLELIAKEKKEPPAKPQW
jgi:hypothetical protein